MTLSGITDAAASLPERQPRSTMWMIMGATFALAAGNGVVFGLLAEIQDARGLTVAELGLISASLFGASLIGLIGLAHFADKGHSRAMLLGGLAIGSVSTIWFGVAEDLWEFVASRTLSGIAASLFLAAGQSVVSRLDPHRVAENLGRLNGAEVSGFILGPALGTLLFSIGGLSLPFFVLGAASGLALVYFAVKLPALPENPEPTRLTMWQSTGLDLLGNRGVLAAALLTLVLFLPDGAYDSIWSRYLTDLGASQWFVGLSLTLYGLPFVLFAGLGGRYVDRSGPRRAFRRSLFVLVPVVVAYGFTRNYWLVALTAIVEACVECVAGPSAQAAMSAACPPERLGAGHGLGAALGLAGAGLLASVTPALYESVGPTVLFGGVAVAMVLVSTASFALDRSNQTAVSDRHEPPKVGAR